MAEKKGKADATDNYPPVIQDIHEWPIYKISSQREKLIETVIQETMADLAGAETNSDTVLRSVADAYFQERIRMKEEPWKVDPKDEPAFWRRIRSRLQAASGGGEIQREEVRALLEQILDRYANEIAGDFRIGTYKFAVRATNFGFTRLFNAANTGWFRGLWDNRLKLKDRMQIVGEVDKVRELAKKGTVILVPTHFSNLDSIVLGWAIEAMGLPAFTYGAGINLFGHPVLSYFMRRLGAFRVDRRKKNEVYLKTLKVYTENVLRQGGHMLFFPGGTRSRGGNIETRLKLGLLGTAFDAQRKLIEANPKEYRRLYIVPLVMSYHTVLEANSLIDQHLKREGKERYVLAKDDFRSMRKTMSYIWNFFKSKSKMVFSVGEPTDLFGNRLNEAGVSIDRQGRPLDLADYYQSEGEVRHDAQRTQAYTRILGERILASYYRENIVFSSHLVAFVALSMLTRHYRKDIYNLLTIPEEDMVIPMAEFRATMERVHVRLREMEVNNQVRLAEHMRTDIGKIIDHGIRNLGVYHLKKPLAKNEAGDIVTEDLRLLYFYKNRLNGYDLDKYC